MSLAAFNANSWTSFSSFSPITVLVMAESAHDRLDSELKSGRANPPTRLSSFYCTKFSFATIKGFLSVTVTYGDKWVSPLEAVDLTLKVEVDSVKPEKIDAEAGKMPLEARSSSFTLVTG